MTFPLPEEYSFYTLLREIRLYAKNGKIRVIPCQNYSWSFILFIQKAGYDATLVDEQAYFSSNGDYLVDLRILENRRIYPYSTAKILHELKMHRGSRQVRIIPSEQTDLLKILLDKENIPYYIAKPAEERCYDRQYEINLLEMKIIL